MQEKQDSLTVTVKGSQEFIPDNESFTTEPPPAYRQPRSTAVQVAKIVAVTVVAASAILGACILASAWIQARATCELMMMEHQLHEAEMRAVQDDRPSFQALVQEGSSSTEDVPSTTTAAPVPPSTQQDSEEESQDNDVHRIKLPLQLDFDELAGSLMERNQRAHMNCVVEKRRSEELVDHAPRAVQLPFGLNLTTPPRLEHLTGERMVISCESSQDHQKQMPMPIMLPMPGMHPMAHPMPFHQGMHPQQQQQSQHHGPEMAMIVEHRSAVPPVPLSAMVPPPQHPQMPMQHQQMQHQQMQQEQHHPEGRAFQPEGRSFQGFPIPIHIQEMDSEDQQRDESAQHVAEAHRLFPGIVQIRQINVHEPAPQQMRPHYVQPRSVPSNPDFLQGNKRVKRCACNCDC